MSNRTRKAAQQVRRKQVSFLVNEREHAALARKARAARVSAGEYIRNTCGLSASKRNAGARGVSPEPEKCEATQGNTVEALAEVIAGYSDATPADSEQMQASAFRILSQASAEQAHSDPFDVFPETPLTFSIPVQRVEQGENA